jgi:DNA invertase Pin-like site-specific DNA recombinase
MWEIIFHTNKKEFITIERSFMIYGYIRVSSDKQSVENQRFEINRFCKNNSLVVENWVEESISGTKSIEERELGKLLKTMQKDDVFICSELSRLGRNLYMIMSVLNECMNRGIKIQTIKDNFCLGDDIQSKVIAFAFSLSAEIERNLISQRTIEALARKRSEGIILGRKIGSKSKKIKLSGKEGEIKTLLESGISKAAISKIYGVGTATLWRFLKDKAA